MSEKEIIYECKCCNYETNIKSNFLRHQTSDKHIERNSLNDMSTFKFNCVCGKTYKGRDGLWRHQQKCITLLQQKENNEKEDTTIWKEMIKTLINQNNEWQNKYMELQKILVEENKEFRDTIANIQSNKSNTINNFNNINNCINNNTFNLQLFLNETCKDAMNIDDFIDSIEISIEDLKHLGKAGYVEGISDLFIKNLEELDITKRPLHCSDIKRETVYIRDKNLWTKENDQKIRLTKVATDIARLNTKALQNEYQKTYPNCLTDFKSKEHTEYGKIAFEAFGGKLDIEKANKKIFRNIMKVVTISKNAID